MQSAINDSHDRNVILVMRKIVDRVNKNTFSSAAAKRMYDE
ncbi:UNVERIFIED_ORG: hypothetical protein QOE_3026 [Clostridioides difficile F501]